jgi:aromatic ring-opening dioxygenase LigB subunit
MEMQRFFAWRQIFCVILLLQLLAIYAKVQTAVVMPHGDFVYAPQLIDYRNGSRELNIAAQVLGEDLAGKYDTIFLTTPHGLALQNLPLLYLNPSQEGVAILGGDVINGSASISVSLHMQSDEDISSLLYSALGGSGGGGREANVKESSRIEGLVAFGGDGALPLNWGEIVPLRMLLPNASGVAGDRMEGGGGEGQGGRGSAGTPKLVVLSFPSRR